MRWHCQIYFGVVDEGDRKRDWLGDMLQSLGLGSSCRRGRSRSGRGFSISPVGSQLPPVRIIKTEDVQCYNVIYTTVQQNPNIGFCPL